MKKKTKALHFKSTRKTIIAVVIITNKQLTKTKTIRNQSMQNTLIFDKSSNY